MKKIYYIKSFLFVLLLVAIDQITKYLSVIYLKDINSFPIIKGILEFTYLENYGAAFGMLQNKTWFFILLTIVVSIFLVVHFYRISKAGTMPMVPSLLLVLLSGAIGNFIDRILYGFVVDFIYVRIINFPVFNVADCYVTISVALLIIYLLFIYKDEE